MQKSSERIRTNIKIKRQDEKQVRKDLNIRGPFQKVRHSNNISSRGRKKKNREKEIKGINKELLRTQISRMTGNIQ